MEEISISYRPFGVIPEADYIELGTDYYEPKADTRRHVRGLERLGYKVTIEAIDPGTGELIATAG
jgi:hypothetical protein